MEQMNMLKKFWMVISQPNAFFKRIKHEKGYLAPWLFYVVFVSVFLIMYLPAYLLVMRDSPEYGSMGFGVMAIVMAISFIVLTVLFAGFVFAGAGIMHLILLIVGSKESYYRTFQIACYSWAPMVFFAPFAYMILMPKGAGLYLLAAFAIGIYSMVIQVKGAMSLHSLSTWRVIIGLVVIPIMITAMAIVIMAIFVARIMAVS